MLVRFSRQTQSSSSSWPGLKPTLSYARLYLNSSFLWLRHSVNSPFHASAILARPLKRRSGSGVKANPSNGDQQKSQQDKESIPVTLKVRSFDFKDPGPLPASFHNQKYPSMLPLARKVLKEHHGYSTFRGEQEKVIARLQNKGPTIYMMQTGGGKSLIYQILARTIPDPGLILIVVPLISLLRDQVKAARAVGLEADGIDGTMSEGATADVLKRLRKKKTRMLFVSPERLNDPNFRKHLAPSTLLLLVIDEAHLIPLEGPRFRTAYLDLTSFFHQYRPQRLLLTTATATEQWLEDLAYAFQVPDDGIFRASVHRPNLSLQVRKVERSEDKYQELLDALQEYPGAAIVYASARKGVERLADRLREELPDREVYAYHARIHSKVRNHIQERFTALSPQGMPVVVSTKAFGMGLNKSNVRQVIHYDLSPNPSEYLQEVGRAGRDGLPSRCLTLYLESDPRDCEKKIRSFQPTLPAVYTWVCAMCDKGLRSVKEGRNNFEYDLFNQTRSLNIEHATLQQLFKLLELKAGYQYLQYVSARANPFQYTIRKPKPRKGQKALVDPEEVFAAFKKRILDKDPSKEAEVLLHNSYRRKSTWYVKIQDLTSEDIILQDLRNKMMDWSEGFKINLESQGQIDKFQFVQALPILKELREKLAQDLYQELLRRVDLDLHGLDTMVDIIEGKDKQCMAARLADIYSSDSKSSGSWSCGKCTVCCNANETHPTPNEQVEAKVQPVSRPKRALQSHATHSSRKRNWHRRYLRELELFEKVYKVVAAKMCFTKEKNDAEFLCKLAFGVPSIKLSMQGLRRSKVSGTLGHWHYQDLLEAFKVFIGTKTAVDEDSDNDDTDTDQGSDGSEGAILNKST